MFNPHKLGIHKILQHIPLNAIFDAPYKRRLARAVNIADLRLIAKSRAHKVRRPSFSVESMIRSEPSSSREEMAHGRIRERYPEPEHHCFVERAHSLKLKLRDTASYAIHFTTLLVVLSFQSESTIVCESTMVLF